MDLLNRNLEQYPTLDNKVNTHTHSHTCPNTQKHTHTCPNTYTRTRASHALLHTFQGNARYVSL